MPNAALPPLQPGAELLPGAHPRVVQQTQLGAPAPMQTLQRVAAGPGKDNKIVALGSP